MSDTNPEVNPAQAGDNAQGISIDAVLGGNTAPEQGGTPDLPAPPANDPPANDPPAGDNNTPPAGDPPAPADAPADEIQAILLSADNLNADDLALRDSIYNKFGGVSVDANGNMLDARNQIVLTKANLDNYIDNNVLLLDANGNHVNELGQIITPAEQVQATNTFVSTAKDAVEQEYGFQFLDKDGQPKVYANNAEGNIELLKDAVQNTKVNAVKSFLDSNPELKQRFFHYQNGGTDDTFVNDTFDYTQVEVAGLTREQKINYIKAAFEKQGIKNAGSTIKLLETASDEALNEPVSDALLTLNKVNEDARTKAEADYNASVQAQAKADAEYWNEIKGRIEGGKIKNINIPATEKDNFFSYIATAVDSNGRSQEQIDAESEDPDFGLMISYLRYKKLDLDTLIKIRSKDSRLSNARERFNTNQPAPVPSQSTPAQRSGHTISLESL